MTMVRVWIRTPTGYEIELSESELCALLSDDWLDTSEGIGEIASDINKRLGMPVKVEEVCRYFIGYPV